jgi:O-6-methylguanine DNA methyltransferase
MTEYPPDLLDCPDPGDAYAPLETPIGRLFVAFDGPIITVVGRTPAAVESALRTRFARRARRVPALPSPLASTVAEHLNRADQTTLRFNLDSLPQFDRAVLLTVLTIPRGEVRSYAWVANEIGEPRAAKDVGLALGQNPIPLLIPCHRVIYSDGRLGGYIFGPRAKRALLLAEGVELPVINQAA